MDKQAQDKLWDDLSEENRKTLQFEYQDYIDDIEDSEVCDIERANLEGRVKVMKALFGSHNLNPKQIKTWEDYEKVKGKINVWVNVTGYIPEDKVSKKAVATLKIAKLIELGYGGMVSEEEALDNDLVKSAIDLYDGEVVLHTEICKAWGDRFLMFRSNEYGMEFMSYESNKILVRQYYMM